MLPPHGLGLYEIKKMDQERGCKLEEEGIMREKVWKDER